MLEPTSKSIGMLENSIADQQDHDDSIAIQNAIKITAHALIIPLLLGIVVNFIVGLVYFLIATVLYSTIFKEKREQFFAMLAFEMVFFMGYILLMAG